MIHELTFGGQIQTDIEYIFRGIGDEHPLFGKRDLKVRLLYVSASYLNATLGAEEC
jgi:hypothetical protein